MRQFILKISLFILLYLGLRSLIGSFFPYYHANPWYGAKVVYLENLQADKPNTLFIGSSRIYRQIIPAVFDSLMTHDGRQCKSFNLGAPGVHSLESYYLLRHAIRTDLLERVGTVFMELGEWSVPADEQLHNERIGYWMDHQGFIMAMKFILSRAPKGRLKMIGDAYTYGVAYLERFFGLGYYSEQLKQADYFKVEYLGPGLDGYYSLENNMIHTEDPEVYEGLNRRFQKLRNNPQLIKRIKEQTVDIRKNIDKDKYNSQHLDVISDLIEQTSQIGIHLVFILPPRSVNNDLLALASKIPENHVIDLARPSEYKELYMYESYFDETHLNENGARFFTRFVEEAFVKLKMHE